MIGYYSFDGSNANDLSGNLNHGTVGSNLFFTADVAFGSGLAAGSPNNPGNGDPTRVINVPTSPSLESIDDQLTVSFWMKATTANNNNWVRIFQHGTEANGARTWLVDRDGGTNTTNVRVDTVGAGGGFNQNIARGGPNTFNDTWHHVLYTLDTGSWAKYVDKARTTGTYNDGDGLYNTRYLNIFGRNNDGEYVGLLDDIGIWNSRLSAAEAYAIYNLAMTPALAYGAGNAQTLFDLFAAGSGVANIGSDFWKNTSGLGGSPGDVVHVHGGLYGLVLGPNGAGVVMTPEPSTLLIWSLLAGLAFAAGWRRRR